MIAAFFQSAWQVLLDLAPWLLVGSALAGLLHVLLPPDFIRRQLTGAGGVAKAVILGVPLPLCSCGVIPAGIGLKRDGASQGASLGFLISTPQTGVDSVLVSASFLGWPFALFKVAAAAVTGLAGGWWAEALPDTRRGELPTPCVEAGAQPRGSRLRSMVEHALEILRSVWRWLVLGIVLSAAIDVLVPDRFFASLGALGSLGAGLAALAISLPLYVCATASVPIAAALVAGGMPAGAAIVFLMAGPASNVATIGAVLRTFGRAVTAVYLVTIVVGSLAAGVLFDFLLTAQATAAVHRHESSPWAAAASVLLLLLLGWFAGQDLRSAVEGIRSRRSTEPTTTIGVDGLTCGNCAQTLQRELGRVAGVSSARVELESGTAVVAGRAEAELLHRAVRAAGFTVR